MGRRVFIEPSAEGSDRKGKKRGSDTKKVTRVDAASKSPQNPWNIPAGKSRGELKGGKQSLFLSPYRLLMFNHSPATWQGVVSNKWQTIGQAEDAAIRLSEDFMDVDSYHASIWANEKGIWIKDLGSKGGTRVNGIPVVHEFGAQIIPGDLIQLGNVMLYLSNYSDSSYQGPAAMLLEKSKPKKTLRRNPKVADPYAGLKSLTRAQYLALLWIHRGFVTDYEIARQTHRSPNTVRTHITKLREKLGVHSRLELLSYVLSLM